jgi:DNA-binding XRE family transcriptional regulator
MACDIESAVLRARFPDLDILACDRAAGHLGFCSFEAREPASDARPADGDFGALLRRYRESVALSQNGLAHVASASPATVNRLEAGARRPTAVMVGALALGLLLSERETDALYRAAGFLPKRRAS